MPACSASARARTICRPGRISMPARPGPGARSRRRAARGSDGRAQWVPVGVKDVFDTAEHADRERLAVSPGGAQSATRPALQRSGIPAPSSWENGDDGARAADAGEDAQPARSRPHAERLIGRLGRRRRRPHDTRLPSAAERPRGTVAGLVLQHLWLQADAPPRCRARACSCSRTRWIQVGLYARSMKTWRSSPTT